MALERWLIDFLLLAAAAAFFTLRLAAAFCFALEMSTPADASASKRFRTLDNFGPYLDLSGTVVEETP